MKTPVKAVLASSAPRLWPRPAAPDLNCTVPPAQPVRHQIGDSSAAFWPSPESLSRQGGGKSLRVSTKTTGATRFFHELCRSGYAALQPVRKYVSRATDG